MAMHYCPLHQGGCMSGTPPLPFPYTVDELLTAYAAEYLPAKSPRTRYQQEHLFRWLHRELGHYKLTELTPVLLRSWKGTLLTRYKPGTVRRYMGTLHAVLNVAVKHYEWLRDNPLDKVSQPPSPKGRTRFLSDDERRRLLDACKASKQRALYPMVLLALTTGMRRGEVQGLRWPDIDFTRGQLQLRDTKNGEARPVPLPRITQDCLKVWRERRRNDVEWVFPGMGDFPLSVDGAWRVACRNAGLQDFRYHDLRHSAASYLAMSGADLREIAEILGHKNISMSRKYAHLATSHMGQVVERMTAKFFDL